MTMEKKKQEKNRDTLGKISQDLMHSDTFTDSLAEQGRAMTKRYLADLYGTILESKVGNPTTDFFIQVETIKDRLLHNVIKRKFIARLSCPTPNYDQDVWHYKYKDDELFHLWTIPNREYSYKLLNNAAIIDLSLRDLTNNVIAFASGDLYKLCKKLNNEEELESLVVLKETQETKDDGREQSRHSKPTISTNGSSNRTKRAARPT